MTDYGLGFAWFSSSGPCPIPGLLTRACKSWPREARQERAKFDDEIPRHEQCPEGEHHVAGHSHSLPESRRVVERAATRISEPMFVDGVELRPADGKEVEHDPEHHASVV